MQVGKISVEWLAGEKTKVAGTYPPRKRGWTGYVEKDTAGQTNIYSVEVSYCLTFTISIAFLCSSFLVIRDLIVSKKLMVQVTIDFKIT